MTLLIARPRGFCAGVARAVEILERALARYGSPLYVRREIVHNMHVLEAFRRLGVRFVDEVDEIPRGSVAVFSAHGVSPAVRRRAEELRLTVVDATCPLVSKVHGEAAGFAQLGYAVILIGHPGHDEVVGVMGVVPGNILLVSTATEAAAIHVEDGRPVAAITQTTLSVADTRDVMGTLRARFPGLVTPSRDDICYATQNRQAAARLLALRADVVLVAGSRNSSNSNRLKEVAQAAGADSHLVEDSNSVRDEWIEGAECVGLTAGASTPDDVIRGVETYFRERWHARVEELEAMRETIRFPIPADLYQLGTGAVS